MHPAVKAEVEKITGTIRKMRSLSGGDISEIFCVESQQGSFAIKTHASPPPGFFASEERGLNLLRTHGLDVPQVFAATDAFLLMEYLPAGKAEPRKAGETLARLHTMQQPKYGLESDTYLATLVQNNHQTNDWADFYWKQRLIPVLESLPEYREGEKELWRDFSVRVAPMLKTCSYPALLHGDLWNGNLYHSSRGPVFIDPACYAGDPLVDIAMTKLFGGFSGEFYAAYAANMPRRNHAEVLIRIYQIYPLLVHARLFGNNRSATGGYYRSATTIRDAVRDSGFHGNDVL